MKDKFVCLMDLALMAMRKLKKDGKLDDMEEVFYISRCQPNLVPVGRISSCRPTHQLLLGSDEINACSVIVPVEMDYGEGPVSEEWILFAT
mgnify:CR=1 FL=1